MWIFTCKCSTMYRNSIIALVMLILILERWAFTSPMNISTCFTKEVGNHVSSWCPPELTLCTNESFAYIMSVSTNSGGNIKCNETCTAQSTDSVKNFTLEVFRSKCNGQRNCSLANVADPSNNHAGTVTLTFLCNNTESAADGPILDDGNEADNNTTNNTGTTTETTISTTKYYVTSAVIRTTKNSTITANYSIPSTGDNRLLTGTTQPLTDNSTTNNTGTTAETTVSTSKSSVTSTAVPITNKSTMTTDDSISSTGKSTLQADTAQPLTGSGNPYTAVITVSVVVPILIVVSVVAVLMYRSGQCKLLLDKCTKSYAKHSPESVDAYAMSSTTHANLTYNLSRSVDVDGSDVDYCEINNISKDINVDYNHVILKKIQAGQDPTYNHIGHLNSTSGDTEPTYNHVGDEMLKNTNCSKLQPDTYSHIGAMANPASGQLADNSYAHIIGVMKYIPTADDVNQYDCAIFESNDGPAGDFGKQECDIKSSMKREFNVVGPSNVDSNNEAPVSHSYFILEKHEKEA